MRLTPPVTVATRVGEVVFDSATQLFLHLENLARDGRKLTGLRLGAASVHPVSVGALNAYLGIFGVGYFLRRITPHSTRSRHNWHALFDHLGMRLA